MEAEKVKKVGDANWKRVSSALIGFPLVAIILVIGNKYMIDFCLAIIAILSMHEYLHAAARKSNPIKWTSFLSCAAISLLSIVPQELYGNVMLYAIPILLLILFM